MSQSRRPSVSIYDYPEHLNPFNEDQPAQPQPQNHRDSKNGGKETKHKFWTFGRSRKKRSNSFSIKSTWNGLFGKRKDVSDTREKRSTITTVSSTYKSDPNIKPVAPPRISKDQQEFDEALGTLARRRKYTLDSSSWRSSSLTVNGDPARIYDGSPQETTTSIMGELTPKPPARRFGQVSPKPTDEIPPLDYEEKEPKENGSVTLRDKAEERTPVPPLRRLGNRSSQRLNASSLDTEEEANRSGDAVALRDENENVPEDYIFKRFTQDAVRRSNLSINSCVSIGSTASSYGRKKRRAPQPPCRKEKLESAEENATPTVAPDASKIELQIVEPIDIARVTRNIDALTKKSEELVKNPEEQTAAAFEGGVEHHESQMNEAKQENLKKEEDERVSNTDEAEVSQENGEVAVTTITVTQENVPENNSEGKDEACMPGETEAKVDSSKAGTEEESVKKDSLKDQIALDDGTTAEENVQIEYRRTSQENLEIIKDVDVVNSTSELEEVRLRRKSSSDTLSRTNSFSVKDEIEKIERQIKALESRQGSRESSEEECNELKANGRLSIQENRKHFFQDMVDDESEAGMKIEFKELPREQTDIHVVRLTDPPVPVAAPREPVKVIELHISEPIRRKPEILDAVNPVPKPRRHNSLSFSKSHNGITSEDDKKSPKPTDKRGKSF